MPIFLGAHPCALLWLSCYFGKTENPLHNQEMLSLSVFEWAEWSFDNRWVNFYVKNQRPQPHLSWQSSLFFIFHASDEETQ